MQWTLEQDGERGRRLRLSGEVSVACGTELRHALQQALEGSSSITVEIAEGMEMDLAGLQLLCAAHKSLAGSTRTLALNKPVPDSFRRVVESAGLLRHQGCLLNPYGNCLWIGGNLS